MNCLKGHDIYICHSTIFDKSTDFSGRMEWRVNIYTHKHTRIAGGAAQRRSRSMKKRIFCSIKIQFKYFVCYFFAVVLCFVVMCSSVYYAIRFELLIVVRWVRNSMWCAQNITILKKKKIECEGTNRSVRVAGEKGKWRWMFLSFCAFFFFFIRHESFGQPFIECQRQKVAPTISAHLFCVFSSFEWALVWAFAWLVTPPVSRRTIR